MAENNSQDDLDKRFEWYDNKYRHNELLTTGFVIFFLVTMFVKFLFF